MFTCHLHPFDAFYICSLDSFIYVLSYKYTFWYVFRYTSSLERPLDNQAVHFSGFFGRHCKLSLSNKALPYKCIIDTDLRLMIIWMWKRCVQWCQSVNHRWWWSMLHGSYLINLSTTTYLYHLLWMRLDIISTIQTSSKTDDEICRLKWFCTLHLPCRSNTNYESSKKNYFHISRSINNI